LYPLRFAANVFLVTTTYIDTRRPRRQPPLVGIGALRRAHGWTLDQVRFRVAEILDAPPLSRGSLSAIESGSRGASPQVLAALAQVYGLAITDLVVEDAA
jgi:hypothetical protein